MCAHAHIDVLVLRVYARVGCVHARVLVLACACVGVWLYLVLHTCVCAYV